MGAVLILKGSASVAPTVGTPSGEMVNLGPIEERVLVGFRLDQQFDLTVDTAVVVPVLRAASGPFNAGAHVLMVKVVGGKVRVRITTSDGSTQAIPVDSFLSLISLAVPITAVDFTRVASTLTTVKLFMAEKL